MKIKMSIFISMKKKLKLNELLITRTKIAYGLQFKFVTHQFPVFGTGGSGLTVSGIHSQRQWDKCITLLRIVDHIRHLTPLGGETNLYTQPILRFYQNCSSGGCIFRLVDVFNYTINRTNKGQWGKKDFSLIKILV